MGGAAGTGVPAPGKGTTKADRSAEFRNTQFSYTLGKFSVQLRAYDASKAGQSLGMAALLAMCGTLIDRSLRGGMVVVGGLNRPTKNHSRSMALVNTLPIPRRLQSETNLEPCRSFRLQRLFSRHAETVYKTSS
jgi:hypothetical protein